jgi:multiple sugar transport system ATP-binding protein
MNLIPGITKKSGKSFAVEIFGTKLPLPKIKNLIDGQEVLIGVRPEQLIPGKSGIPATVAIVEPTGSETHLIVRSGEQELISVIRERSSFSVGEEIHLSSDKSSLHIFDSKTSERLNDD